MNIVVYKLAGEEYYCNKPCVNDNLKKLDNLESDKKFFNKNINQLLIQFNRLVYLESPVVWKNVPGFTKYEASTDGRIRNVRTKKILTSCIICGYYSVYLYRNKKRYTCRINRLVAATFIPNYDNFPIVDHIDNNKLNNHVTNLRWVTKRKNMQEFCDNYKEKRIILQYDLNGNLIKQWNSMTEVLKNNLLYKQRSLYWHIKRGKGSMYGYKWKCDPPIMRQKKPDPNEKFKPINNFEGFDLSNYGASKTGKIINFKTNLLMTAFLDENGYFNVNVQCAKTNKRMRRYVHRLVSHVYIPNDDPQYKIQVNHIDENRSNNYYQNLEWITPQGNAIHSCGKMVKMLDPATNEIFKVFRCMADANRYLGKDGANGSIGAVCNGKQNTCFGYKWEWVSNDEVIDMPIIAIPIEQYRKGKINYLDQ